MNRIFVKTTSISTQPLKVPFHFFRSALILIQLTLILCVSASARQGFHDEAAGLPPHVQTWAQRVFLVYDEVNNSPVGTAFLVHHDGSGSHFITANHVAETCLGYGSCSLRFGGKWEFSMLGKHFVTPIMLQIKSIKVFDPITSDWNLAGATADMAYLRADASPVLPMASVDQLGLPILSQIKEKAVYQRHHFLMGYPNLRLRPSLQNRDDANYIRLRWSEGEMISKTKFGTKYRINTDLDSLPGNSGGPVVHEDGTLLGILYGGPNNYEYMGYPNMYSYIVPIDNVRQLIGDILLKRSNHKNLCDTPYGKMQKSCLEHPFPY